MKPRSPALRVAARSGPDLSRKCDDFATGPGELFPSRRQSARSVTATRTGTSCAVRARRLEVGHAVAVEHDPDRTHAVARGFASREERIIGFNRADADQDGIHSPSQLMDGSRESSDEIQRLSPEAVAVLPSRVMAHFAVT